MDRLLIVGSDMLGFLDRMRRSFGAAVVAAFLFAPPAAAQNPLDGESLRVDGAIYRLYGIDAPDRGHICADGWPAGHEAREYLGRLIEGKEVTCVLIERRRNGETTALCRADGVDLGGAMVTAGQAFAFVPYSARYVAHEDAAASAGRGVHAHGCVAPWIWRRRLERDH
jgi:endonuclease YncB( thermonuclease family)